jgi:hypothetical protein
MALGESLLFYLLIGVAVAAAVVISGERREVLQPVAAAIFWPLFIPILLSRRSASERVETNDRRVTVELDDALARNIAQVDDELSAALASLDGWAESALARERVRIDELRSAWRAQAQRIREMDRVLATMDAEPHWAPDVSHEAGRAGQSVRARRDNFDRLRNVREQANADLATTLASVRELVSMIHLAKFTGAPASRADELVTQIAAAVEGMSEVATWGEVSKV